jgi:7-cyano-7-deazaguanine synthase in queuosine biosynthesis
MAFLLLGLMNSRAETGAVALGIHHGTPYADCSPGFVALAQKVFDLYTGGRVRVEAPFASWDKVDIAIYCLKERLPRALSYSCELGLDQPCGRCKSCRDLIALDGPAGYRAPSGRP